MDAVVLNPGDAVQARFARTSDRHWSAHRRAGGKNRKCRANACVVQSAARKCKKAVVVPQRCARRTAVVRCCSRTDCMCSVNFRLTDLNRLAA
ncbi:MAG: hypothetical protein WC809_20325 [Sinimarinibacterium sp.]|jgi:hypothetical protein